MASGYILDWDTRGWRPALVPQVPTQVLLYDIKIQLNNKTKYPVQIQDLPPPKSGLDPAIARVKVEMIDREEFPFLARLVELVKFPLHKNMQAHQPWHRRESLDQ